MNPSQPTTRRRLLLALLGVAVLGVAGGLAVVLTGLWDEYDPFVLSRPANREATALRDAARQRPLTADEFDRCVRLLAADQPVAQLSAIATLAVEADRDPARKPAVLGALDACAQTAPPRVAKSAATVAGRLRAAP